MSCDAAFRRKPSGSIARVEFSNCNIRSWCSVFDIFDTKLVYPDRIPECRWCGLQYSESVEDALHRAVFISDNGQTAVEHSMPCPWCCDNCWCPHRNKCPSQWLQREWPQW